MEGRLCNLRHGHDRPGDGARPLRPRRHGAPGDSSAGGSGAADVALWPKATAPGDAHAARSHASSARAASCNTLIDKR